MRDFIYITKALADENRVKILWALRGNELCVCQLIELLELAPSTVSKHLSNLKAARLIDCRKQGRWIFYRLTTDKDFPMATRALEWVFQTIASAPEIKADTLKLEEILKIDPEILCSRQGRANNCANR